MKSHVVIHFQKEKKPQNYIVFCHIQFAQQRKTHEYQLWPYELISVVKHPAELCWNWSFLLNANQYHGLLEKKQVSDCQPHQILRAANSLSQSLALGKADLSSCSSKHIAIFFNFHSFYQSRNAMFHTDYNPCALLSGRSQGLGFWTLDSIGKVFLQTPGAKSYPPYLWMLLHYLLFLNNLDIIIWGWQFIKAPHGGIQHSRPPLPACLLTGWCIAGAQPGSHRKALSE